jgi:hypothetical protein
MPVKAPVTGEEGRDIVFWVLAECCRCIVALSTPNKAKQAMLSIAFLFQSNARVQFGEKDTCPQTRQCRSVNQARCSMRKGKSKIKSSSKDGQGTILLLATTAATSAHKKHRRAASASAFRSISAKSYLSIR